MSNAFDLQVACTGIGFRVYGWDQVEAAKEGWAQLQGREPGASLYLVIHGPRLWVLEGLVRLGHLLELLGGCGVPLQRQTCSHRCDLFPSAQPRLRAPMHPPSPLLLSSPY